jgi:hypothetical protein
MKLNGTNTLYACGEIELCQQISLGIQNLQLSTDQLSISGGNAVTLPDASSTNELQTLGLTGGALTISLGNSVTLPDASATNEIQTLGLNGASLSISSANTVTLPDASSTNEIQTLGVNGQILSISSANSVTLPVQSLSLAGTTLSISGANSVVLGGVYSASGEHFFPWTSGYTYSGGGGQGGATVTGGAGFRVLGAPVSLPHGARLISMTWYIVDNAVNDLTCEMTPLFLSGSFYTSFASATSTGASATAQTIAVPVAHIVDNTNLGYWARCFVTAPNGDWTNIYIRGFVIRYN